MNKTIVGLVVLCFVSLMARAEHVMIGEEKIVPLLYPKSSMSSSINLGRNFVALAGSRSRTSLKNHFDVGLSFEAGLLSYFNAGAIFNFSIPWSGTEILVSRLSLFAKPYWALNERLSIFGRVGAGIGTSSGNHATLLTMDSYTELKSAVGNATHGPSYGANAFASVGIEYFPWTRVGFAIEGGVRAEIFRSHVSKEPGQDMAPQARALNYLVYSFPIGLVLHVII